MEFTPEQEHARLRQCMQCACAGPGEEPGAWAHTAGARALLGMQPEGWQ